jgi:hypothetical protein
MLSLSGAHGALSDTQVCACGCFVKGVSRLPRRMRITSGLLARYA